MSASPDDMSFLDRLGVLSSGLDKQLQPYGGAQNLGLSLLANSGYSQTPRTFGQTLGVSALQAQNTNLQQQKFQQDQQDAALMKRYREAQIASLQARPDQPATVQEYEYAKRNGYSGTFEEWQAKTKQANDPADVATYKYWATLTPEQQQNMLKLKRNVGSDYAIETVNGVPTVVYKPAAGGYSATPLTTPLTTLPQQASGASAIKQAEATGGAIGTAEGGIAGGIQTKASNAVGTKNLLDMAEPLIDASTSSLAGAARDKVVGVFGMATEGAQANAQLKVLQAGLMTSMPRMEGPQSDRDVALYREAAGQIGDPTVPADLKKRAVETIRQIQDKYIERASGASASKYREGQTAKNPKTGETIVFHNGAWGPK